MPHVFRDEKGKKGMNSDQNEILRRLQKVESELAEERRMRKSREAEEWYKQEKERHDAACGVLVSALLLTGFCLIIFWAMIHYNSWSIGPILLGGVFGVLAACCWVLGLKGLD